MKITDFQETIEKLFGQELLNQHADDYGFTFTTDKPVTKMGYCTNISLEVIEEAASQGVDLILTHHDAWDFLYGMREACVKKLKEHNISHFFIHGPLDFVEFGTCTSLMEQLGIEIQQYSYYDGGDFPGIGEFEQAVSFSELTDRMRRQLDEPVRAWKNHDQPVKRVGVLTGAGHSTDYMKVAVDAGCDTYITGEATLYSIQYAQFAGINLLAGSHTFTEIAGVASLAERIKQRHHHHEIEIVKLREEHFELNH